MGFGVLFFSASRSKNRSSLALSSVWAEPALHNASISKVTSNILIFIYAFLLPRYESSKAYRILSWGRQVLCADKVFLFFGFEK